MNSEGFGLKKKPVRVALIGARMDGQAGVILDVLSFFNDVEVVAFFDNTPELKNTRINGIPVLGDIDDFENKSLIDIDFFHISIGDNKARYETYKKLKEKGQNLLTVIHPTAVISKTAKIEEGCFIGANSVVQNNVKLSNVALVNTSAVIEHDNIIGEAVHIAPGARTAGRVQIKDLAFIGIGATILPDILIGKSAFIGAGAIVTKDVSDEITMIGYSAKQHSKNIYIDLETKQIKN